MSLSNYVSLENEEAIFDEDITTLMVSAIEQNVMVPQGFVFGKLKQMREQYPLEKLEQDCKAQGNSLILQVVQQMQENPQATIIVPVFKPWDAGKVEPLMPEPKGEYQGLGYGGEPIGKTYWAEVTLSVSKWDKPTAVEIN